MDRVSFTLNNHFPNVALLLTRQALLPETCKV